MLTNFGAIFSEFFKFWRQFFHTFLNFRSQNAHFLTHKILQTFCCQYNFFTSFEAQKITFWGIFGHFWVRIFKISQKNWRQNLKNSLKIARIFEKIEFFWPKNLYKI